MPHSFASRPRAPYAVFDGDRLVARAPTLLALYDFLMDEFHHYQQRRECLARERERGGLPPNPDDFIVPIPYPPSLTVFDAQGVERPELRASWRILGHFQCRDRTRLSRVVDPGWDGDHRPRGRPVPGTGHRGRNSNYLRRPRTQAERSRAIAVLSEEGEPVPTVRGSRRPAALPSSWDDLLRSDYGHRNWKRHRRTQWKVRK